MPRSSHSVLGSAAGRVTFNARSGAHDDLVLSVAIALFGATTCTLAMDYGNREIYSVPDVLKRVVDFWSRQAAINA